MNFSAKLPQDPVPVRRKASLFSLSSTPNLLYSVFGKDNETKSRPFKTLLILDDAENGW